MLHVPSPPWRTEACDDAAERLESPTNLLQPFYIAGAEPIAGRTPDPLDGYGDPCHLAPNGSALQACLLTHALLAAPLPADQLPSRCQSGRVVPPSSALNATDWPKMCGTHGEGQRCLEDADEAPLFCLRVARDHVSARTLPAHKALHARAELGSHGWREVRHAGAGDSKAWLQAEGVGGARDRPNAGRTPRPSCLRAPPTRGLRRAVMRR